MVQKKRPDDARAIRAGSADADRVAAYLRGDARTFAEVDSWIRSELRNRYPRLLDEQEDLCQAVHGKLLANLRADRFRWRSTLRTYVTGVTHYTAIDRLRALYRERALAEAWEPEQGPRWGNPYRSVEAMEESRLLHQVLLALPASCRDLWGLVFVDRLSYEEIGRRLSIPSGTVKSRMWHCRRKAAAILARLRRSGTAPGRH